MLILLSGYTTHLNITFIVLNISFDMRNCMWYPGMPAVSGCKSKFLRAVWLQELLLSDYLSGYVDVLFGTKRDLR